MTERPRILICGWAGAGNVGDELLTRSITQMVIAAGGCPVVTSRDPEATEALHPGVEAVTWGPGVAWSGRDCAGVIVGPGGIIQDSSSVWNLPGHLLAPILFRLRGRPVIGVGLGVEPLGRRISRWLVRLAFPDTTPVVRDPESAAALGASGIEAVVAPDIVFGLTHAGSAPTVNSGEIVVSIGGEVVPGSIRPAAKRLTSDPPEVVANSLDALAARLGGSVSFVSYRGDRDTRFAEDVSARMVTPTRIIPAEVEASVAVVAGAGLVVSSRYHATVVAAQHGVPVVVISDQAKLRSLVTQIGSDLVHLVADWDGVAAADPAPHGAPFVPVGLEDSREAVRELVRRCSSRV